MNDRTNPDPPHRTTRHLAMLAELADLAMALTRAAAEKAQANLEDPNVEPGPDPVLAFTRLARTVRQVIALEARIATPDRQPNDRRPLDRAATDGPREFIAEAVRTCAKADPAATRRHGPTRTHIERHIDERIDADDITTLIDDNASVYEIIAIICEDLGIRCEVADQPDEHLIPLDKALDLRSKARTQDITDFDPDDEADLEDEIPDDAPSIQHPGARDPP